MAQATRRLAAILSADVVGYSRLMGDNEPGTMAALAESQSFFRRNFDANNGRIVDTAGGSDRPRSAGRCPPHRSRNGTTVFD